MLEHVRSRATLVRWLRLKSAFKLHTTEATIIETKLFDIERQLQDERPTHRHQFQQQKLQLKRLTDDLRQLDQYIQRQIK
jgi:hypothetical protein